MAEGEDGPFRGGRQSSRDAAFGIADRDFWRWWHRFGKSEAGGDDLRSKRDAIAAYEDWIDRGRPKVK